MNHFGDHCRIVVVNRGDAALRLIRAVREYNFEYDCELTTIALYTEEESSSSFVREADEAVSLGPAMVTAVGGSRELSYVNDQVLTRALTEARADAAWVGWGFVSEQPEFVDLCAGLGITTIGPRARVMRLLGDKVAAKDLAELNAVAVVPWSGGAILDLAHAQSSAGDIGFPLLVKASAGGGGRGIRHVGSSAELGEALISARREAKVAFGDDTVFLEKVITRARHVEVQVAADNFGNVWILGVRDCSVQRRRQKVVEESGVCGVTPSLIKEISAAAARLIVSAEYTGLGTVEFLLDTVSGSFYFMEVNTRLQVEHTVTEEVCGVDLVKLQLDLAFGRKLEGDPPPAVGYAIEARVTAEDVTENFRPAPGTVVVWQPAIGPGLRMDTGITVGDPTPPEFDPLLLKIIARGQSRDEAIARLRRAVSETRLVLDGGSTTMGFLRKLLAQPEMLAGGVQTDWVDQLVGSEMQLTDDRSDVALLLVAIAVADRRWTSRVNHMFETAVGGRPEVLEASPYEVELTFRGTSQRLAVRRLDAKRYQVTTEDGVVEVETIHRTPYEQVVRCGTTNFVATLLTSSERTQVTIDGNTYRINHGAGGMVTSPLPAIVLQVNVAVGQEVSAGDTLAVLESMKLETPLLATRSGVVREIMTPVNAQVASGDILMRVEDAGGDEIGEADAKVRFSQLLSNSISGLDILSGTLYQLLGFDGLPAGSIEVSGIVDQGEWQGRLATERRILELFSSCCALTGDKRFALYPNGVEIRGRDAVARVLAMPERSHDILPPAYMDDLKSVLEHYGVDSVGGSDESRDALYRMMRASTSLHAVEPVAVEILRRWLGNRTGPVVLLDPSLRKIMEQLAIDCELDFPVVSDLAWAGLREVREDAATRDQRELSRPADPSVWDLSHVAEVLRMRGYRVADDVAFDRSEVSGSVVWVPSEDHLDLPILVCGAPRSWIQLATGLTRRENVKIELLADPSNRLYPSIAMVQEQLARAKTELAHCHIARVTAIASSPTRGDRHCYASTWPREAAAAAEEINFVHPATIERLEFWRFSNFSIECLSSKRDLHLIELTAKDNVDDRRLVAIVGVAQTHDDGESEAAEALLEVEEALLESFARIREQQATVPVPERSLLNRIVLYIDRPWVVAGEDLQQLARRLAPVAKNLGIAKVIARISVPQDDGSLVARVLHLTAPAETGLMFGETEVSDQPLRTMSPRQQKLLKLHRRGLYDPYEIADIMTARSASISDFPPGHFNEMDLDNRGRLTEVGREQGANTAAIVVGTVTNFTEKHPEGMTRVAIFGDPSLGMGALAEDECRRACAALDLAAERNIPLEWFAISSGARISMSSGTENLDWTARVLRRIIEFTQSGGELNVILVGVNVGAQSYFNAEATMLMHTRGVLIMTPLSSMVLTGKEALDFAGGVSAENNLGIGGYDRIMGPNGQAQYWAGNLPEACEILFRHYEHTYVAPGEGRPRGRSTTDAAERDISSFPHPAVAGVDFNTIGDIFSDEHNPGRNRPFDIRAVMHAVIDDDRPPLERWQGMAGAEGAVVWDGHLGGVATCIVGIESRPSVRTGRPPADGSPFWSAATLFPASSKKVARALNSASGNRPVVVLANLAGFDGSPESLRELQLEYGAEIGRAVTNFEGPIVVCVISRYHGGAFVVFSKALNDKMEVIALDGARASVIGGSAAAAVVFTREVERRVAARCRAADGRTPATQDLSGSGDHRDAILKKVRNEVRKDIADEFDRVHSVERAMKVGSVDRVIKASNLRGELIETLRRMLADRSDRSKLPQ